MGAITTEAAEDPAVVYAVVCGGIDSSVRASRSRANRRGVDLVAFSVDSNPDVDPTQLTGDSRSTWSFQGRSFKYQAIRK